MLSWLERQTVGVPVAVALAMMFLVFTAWLLVKNDQTVLLNAGTRSNIEHFAARLETHIATRLAIGEHIRRGLLGGRISSQKAFRDATTSAHELFGDFQALNWIDPEGIVRWVTPHKGNEAAQGLNIRELPSPRIALLEAERTGQVQITPPIELAQGGRGFVAYVPVVKDGSLEGFVNIVFRTAPLINSALREGVLDEYHLLVMDGEETVFDSANMTGAHLDLVKLLGHIS